jgi:type IV pilus assembly protein PilY1
LPGYCDARTTSKGSAWTNTNFTQNGNADQGSSFLFNFSSLAAKGSDTFDIYYGAANNNADALAALAGVGAEVYVLGYSSNTDGTANLDSGTWMFGFSGVGGKPITTTPEPGTLSLCGIGLLGLAKSLRKRSQ